MAMKQGSSHKSLDTNIHARIKAGDSPKTAAAKAAKVGSSKKKGKDKDDKDDD